MNKFTGKIMDALETGIPMLKKMNKNILNILIIAMFLLSCLFSNSVQAREEITGDIFLEKQELINEMILKAGDGITLTGPRTTTDTSIPLSWNTLDGITKYKIYQSKNDSSYKYLTTITGSSITLNQNNANIKDEAIPEMPKVTAAINADKTGNNLIITESTDNGTIYQHYVEADMTNATSGYLVFMVDYGQSNSGFVSNAKTAMKVIGRRLIAQGVKIGIVVNGGDSATAKWDFTSNVSTFESNIDAMYRITHGSMAKRNASCKTNVK